ncbi:MAG: hypothetical protein CO013_09025 [Syntrophobacterales bacterium CG_4_8_14_3_um_filter_58_8]|nr:MAG: hypothetical protein AUK26_14535 [Syntrophaceae bacterium CG2_30_58_14]PIV07115.1 MAG: hypothetical protein COS57_01010 [Syntrophobacterales bacterium CG03_land_8_20_14_0_80_58_14]PJC72516.1 MAG: hypothetical protein CO013_09025 [Syntrophobacterales bacterium CG_4_8_14_3_um_filter_58_8]
MSVFAAILLLTWLWSPAPGLALIALPADIGIDYPTMKVTQAEKLIAAAGMKNVRNGDAISLRASQEGKILIKNIRTGEELIYPPVKQEGK